LRGCWLNKGMEAACGALCPFHCTGIAHLLHTAVIVGIVTALIASLQPFIQRVTTASMKIVQRYPDTHPPAFRVRHAIK
jgi:hypothetical protein